MCEKEKFTVSECVCVCIEMMERERDGKSERKREGVMTTISDYAVKRVEVALDSLLTLLKVPPHKIHQMFEEPKCVRIVTAGNVQKWDDKIVHSLKWKIRMFKLIDKKNGCSKMSEKERERVT